MTESRIHRRENRSSLDSDSRSRFRFDLGVVGLGYVGLPLVVAAIEAGLRVVAYDTDLLRVDQIRAGRSHIEDVSHDRIVVGAPETLAVTTDAALLAECRAIIIAVPTPLEDGQPDLTAVIESATTIGRLLAPGQLVVLESTTYPGTTEEIVRPILEKESGLLAGRDFGLAYSPERIDPGNATWKLENTPKLVAGTDDLSGKLAAELYRTMCADVVEVAGTREAEMAKLLENTYRHVNIALVNEMAIFCHEMGIDVWEVIRAAATKPFGFQAFYPGPGVGGHCIPIDPNYLSYRVRQLGYPFRFVELAGEINSRMPLYVVNRLMLLLNESGRSINGSRVMILGVAYKPGVGDVRETPAAHVIRRLRALGANVAYADPHVPSFAVDGARVMRIEDPTTEAAHFDAVVLLTAHPDTPVNAIATEANAFLDTRGVADVTSVVRL